MSKFNNLNKYQKMIISLLLLMSLIFTAVYLMNISKVGYKYKDTVLVHKIENDVIIFLKLEAYHRIDNIKSGRVFEKSAMSITDTIQRFIEENQSPEDEVCYCITNSKINI